MNLFQIIMVSLAAALGLSVIAGPAWAYFKDVFSVGKDQSILDKIDKPKVDKTNPTLTDLVKEWEDLRTTCNKAGLEKAVEQLDVIFPLLNKGGQNVQNV